MKAAEKKINKYYVRMNEYGVITAGLNGGLVYYTFIEHNETKAKKIFKTLCDDVKNW